MNKRQSGFTLIELVVVITILGILAAFALPRFAGFQGEARLAVIQGIAGSMRSAAALAHAKLLAEGSSANATGTVNMEGTSVQVENGYPTDTAGGIDVAAQIEGSGGITCQQNGDSYRCFYSTTGTCQVVYDNDALTRVTVTATAADCD